MTTAKDIMRKDFIHADKDDILAHIIGKIDSEAFSDVLVFNQHELAGVFSPSSVSRSTTSMDMMKLGVLAKPIRAIDGDTDVIDVATQMARTGYNIMPVTAQGRIIGIVHIFELLNANKELFDDISVADIALGEINSLHETDMIRSAVSILSDEKADAILVLDDHERPVGIINHFDLIRNLNVQAHRQDDKEELQDHGTLPIVNLIKDKSYIHVQSSSMVPEVLALLEQNKSLAIVVEDTASVVTLKSILTYMEKLQATVAIGVDFVGMEELHIEDYEQTQIKETAAKYLDKFTRMVDGDATLKIHLKRHNAKEESKAHRYSVVMHLNYSGNTVIIENTDWDVTRTVLNGLEEIEGRISHQLSKSGATSAGY